MISFRIKDNAGRKCSVEARKIVKDEEVHIEIIAMHDARSGRELPEQETRKIEKTEQPKLFGAYCHAIRGIQI